MLARIINNNDIILDNITPIEEDEVTNYFSASNNNYYIDSNAESDWNGIYCRYNRSRRRLARPFFAELQLFCQQAGFPLAVSDEREPDTTVIDTNITKDYLNGITLEQYQVDAIKKACSVEVGIFDMVTGAGKTEVISGICKAIQSDVVIFADQRIILEQIRERLTLRDINDVELFCYGKTPNGNRIVVGSIQSLSLPKKPKGPPVALDYKTDDGYKKAQKRYEISMAAYKTRKARSKMFRDIVRNVNMIIVDECDLATSSLYKDLFRNVYRGRYRFGFSGTPFDDDKPVHKLFLHEHLGSVIFKVGRRLVENLGRIVPVEFFAIAIGEDGDPKDDSMLDLAINDFIVNNDYFHRVINSVCSKYSDDKNLILVERDDLGLTLERLIPNSVFIHGKTSNKARRQAVSDFQSGKFNNLIGGKIVKRGFDLKGGADNLILTSVGLSRQDFLQRIGRALRVNKRGKSRVFMPYFVCNKHLYKHSRAYIKFAVEAEYKLTVVFRDYKIDGEQFIKSRFHRRKTT